MKILGSIAVLVLGVTLSFGQSGSQPATSSDGSASSSPTTTTRADNGNQDNHNWGWVGLLGLAGLGGLAGRKRENTNRDRSVQDIRRAA